MYVTDKFNKECTHAGVQCTQTLDTQHWQKLHQFHNLSLLRVEIKFPQHLHKLTRVLYPGKKLDFLYFQGEPQVRPLLPITYEAQRYFL